VTSLRAQVWTMVGATLVADQVTSLSVELGSIFSLISLMICINDGERGLEEEAQGNVFNTLSLRTKQVHD